MTLDVPDLRGRRVKATILYDVAGWRIRKATPILYDVGVRDDGTVGRVRAPPGKIECVCVDPDDRNHTVTCILQYPDHIATERVTVMRRSLVNLRRYD